MTACGRRKRGCLSLAGERDKRTSMLLKRERKRQMYDDDYYGDWNDYYRDLERDTFYALTDGQYGDYDEWREDGGDMDSLMDGLGY